MGVQEISKWKDGRFLSKKIAKGNGSLFVMLIDPSADAMM
jgi:hypothetical protein